MLCGYCRVRRSTEWAVERRENFGCATWCESNVCTTNHSFWAADSKVNQPAAIVHTFSAPPDEVVAQLCCSVIHKFLLNAHEKTLPKGANKSGQSRQLHLKNLKSKKKPKTVTPHGQMLQTHSGRTSATPRRSCLEFMWSLVDFTHGDIEGSEAVRACCCHGERWENRASCFYTIAPFTLRPPCCRTFHSMSAATQGCRVQAHIYAFILFIFPRACWFFGLFVFFWSNLNRAEPFLNKPLRQ